MNEKRINVNQIEIQIQEIGQDGDPIIFLHFGGANLMMWQRIIPLFQAEYHLILVDLRGHGQSSKPATGYHIDTMASDVAGVMDQLDLPQAHVVGSSLGAEVGLSLAANYPEKVASLVCDGALESEYGPYSTWEGTEAEFETHVAQQLDTMREMPEQVFPSADAYVASRQEVIGQYVEWNGYFEAVERYNAIQTPDGTYTKAFGKQALLSYMENYFNYRFEDYYKRVTCPLLMLPDADVLENEKETAVMESLRDLAPQAEIVTVSNWMHPYGWLLDPEGACQAILKFLHTINQ